MFRYSFALFCWASLALAQDFHARFAEIRQSATPRELYALLWDLPKGGDLHHHASLAGFAEEWLGAATDGAIARGNEFYARQQFRACPDSPEPFLRWQNVSRFTWQKLSECARAEYVRLQDMDAPARAAWLSSLKLDRPGEGRDEFFERAVSRLQALARDPHVFSEVMARYIIRYGRENLRYLETQFAPTNAVAADGAPIATDQVVEIFRQRLARSDVQAAGVAVRFQHPLIRFTPHAEQTIETAYATIDRHRDLFVGLNLVGREDNDKGHPLRFLDTFRKMRRRYAGVHLAIHAGEKDAPGRQVRDTLLLGAERIGHGVNLITDPDAMLLLRNGRHLVEVSLVSNWLLEYTPDRDAHPFIEYLRFGIPVCLNTDDAGSWDSNLTDEYFTAVTRFNLTWDEVVRLTRNSLEHSFAPEPLKRDRLARLQVALSSFEQKYSAANWRDKLRAIRPEPSGYAERHLLAPAR